MVTMSSKSSPSRLTSLLDRFKKRSGSGQLSREACQGPKRFNEVCEAEQAHESVDRGTSQVEVARIVGTVGRYQDFDTSFKLKDRSGNARYQGILRAMRDGKPMPPVALYLIKDEYYILDGHHRVMAARELGRDRISARIVELLPSSETIENKLYLEKIEFRDKAGLIDSIQLTEPGQYHHLEKQICRHQQFLSQEKSQEYTYRQAAADWYQTIYQPLAALIKKSGLAKSFPGRTVDDLYLYISVQQWEKGASRHYGIGVDKLIPRDMEAFRKKMADLKKNEYPDMKYRITFFVLLNVDGRQERRIIDRLMAIDEVSEVHSVHGAIDLIIKVTLERDLLSSDAELISQFTHTNIRTLKGVHSSQTLIPGFSRIKGQDYLL